MLFVQIRHINVCLCFRYDGDDEGRYDFSCLKVTTKYGVETYQLAMFPFKYDYDMVVTQENLWEISKYMTHKLNCKL